MRTKVIQQTVIIFYELPPEVCCTYSLTTCIYNKIVKLVEYNYEKLDHIINEVSGRSCLEEKIK